MNRRSLLLAVPLAVSGVAALAIGTRLGSKSDLRLPPLQQLLPGTVGNRRAVPAQGAILAPQDRPALQSYDDVIALHYLAPSTAPLTVVVAYGGAQSYATQIHRPEICYPAAGFEITSLADTDPLVEGHSLPAQLLQARRGGRTDKVLFWTRIGASYPRDIWQQRLEVARGVLADGAADGVLVRVSLDDVVGETASEDTLIEFARGLHAACTPLARKLLFGFT